MNHLLAIDPGNTTGVALFVKGELTYASALAFEKFIGNPMGPLMAEANDEVVIEVPKWWPNAHEEVDDLINLARKVGRIEEHYARRGVRVSGVWPHQWKGSVPKEIHNNRVLRALSASELAVVPRKPRAKKHPYDHNMLDAVGIGLWKLGRMR